MGSPKRAMQLVEARTMLVGVVKPLPSTLIPSLPLQISLSTTSINIKQKHSSTTTTTQQRQLNNNNNIKQSKRGGSSPERKGGSCSGGGWWWSHHFIQIHLLSLILHLFLLLLASLLALFWRGGKQPNQEGRGIDGVVWSLAVVVEVSSGGTR